MLFEKLYTVDDIAKMTGLTSRTIRNYLKDGRLKGKKIGAQWRFTKEDIQDLFKEQDFTNEVEKAKNQLVLDYINRGEVDNTSTCTIVDYPCSSSEKMQDLCDRVLKIVNEYKKEGSIKFSYQYFVGLKKARFIIIGDILCVQKILDVIEGNVQEKEQMLI